MKRGTPDHPKMMTLADNLGINKLMAVGIMECLWHWAAKYAPQGDIGKYSDSVIAKQIGWDGEPARLMSALIESKWVDLDPTYRVLIHDWKDHADEAVRKTLIRHKLEFVRVASNVVAIESGQNTDSIATDAAKVRLGLARLGKENPSEVKLPTETEAEEFETWCEAVWDRHPKKKNRMQTFRKLQERFSADKSARKLFERNHALWCATDNWQEKHGRFAALLCDEVGNGWIEDEAWKHPPARDAPVFIPPPDKRIDPKIPWIPER